MSEEERKIYSLQQIASSVKRMFETHYNRFYWVRAEMHKLNRYPSGHCFPELVHKEGDKIVAQMNATIWKSAFEPINRKFVETVKEPLREGVNLLMLVKVVYHEIYGLSLYIQDIDPLFSLGELQRERQETLLRLQKENLLNRNQQLDFPLLPKRIAVISAESSKGLSDFYKVIGQNEWNYRFFTMLFPAYVQGDAASASIRAQLARIARVKHHFDLVVIVRGGGGEIGLSCYNNYELCRDIASFPLPVLTGIGHSTNMTVAEMIAFRNAITPTELGEFLLQCFHNFNVPLNDALKILRRMSGNMLRNNFVNLNHQGEVLRRNVRLKLLSGYRDAELQQNRFQQSARWQLAQTRTRFDNDLMRLPQLAHRKMRSEHEEIAHLRLQLSKTSSAITRNAFTEIEQTQQQLLPLGNGVLREQTHRLDRLAQFVTLSDPARILEKGYSLTTFRGKAVSETNLPEEGEEIITRTATHRVRSTVSNIEKHE